MSSREAGESECSAKTGLGQQALCIRCRDFVTVRVIDDHPFQAVARRVPGVPLVAENLDRYAELVVVGTEESSKAGLVVGQHEAPVGVVKMRQIRQYARRLERGECHVEVLKLRPEVQEV